jgi:glycosyltransferase involved in cell wall biosynthesis
LFAREPLDFARSHTGAIALTRAAAEHMRSLAPRVKVAHLGWGVDLTVFPELPYRPSWFLSCGVTHRDHPTLFSAAERTTASIRVIAPTRLAVNRCPANVSVVTSETGEPLDYNELLRVHYARCAAALVIIDEDPAEYTAVGMTNALEAMAMSRPLIVTRTGALPTEIDVEKIGCGMFVGPGLPGALAAAIDCINENPALARAMGEAGRQHCESHYHIGRFASDLHRFFETF